LDQRSPEFPIEVLMAFAIGDADGDGDRDVAAVGLKAVSESVLEPAPNPLYIND
jgi:hypothetical protein